MIELRVYGTPAPQGSKTAFVRNGKAVLVDGRRGPARQSHAAWRQSVATAARDHLEHHDGQVPWDEKDALALHISFYLAKPKSRRKAERWIRVKPDLSKLVRTVEDALKDGGVVADDARIAYIVTRKEYAVDRQPGAVINLWPLADKRADPRPQQRHLTQPPTIKDPT